MRAIHRSSKERTRAKVDNIHLMTRGASLVSAALLLLLLTLAVRANEQSQAPSPKPQDLPTQVNSEYLGSAACAKCHDVEHTQWKNSLHIKMTKPIAEATVIGDFREGTKFADHDRAYTFGTKDGKPSVVDCLRRSRAGNLHRRLHARCQAISGLSVDAARRTNLRAAGVLACRHEALDRLEGDHVGTGRRAPVPSDLEFQLFQLPRHQPRPGLRRRREKVQVDVDARWASAAKRVMGLAASMLR